MPINVILGGIICVLLSVIWQQRKRINKLTPENIDLQAQIIRLQTIAEQEHQHTGEKLQLLITAKQQMQTEFQQIAQKILDEKGEKFTQQNQNNLQNLLNPLREQIKDFAKTMGDHSLQNAKERGSLLYEVKQLALLNQQISQDAINLTNALRGQAKTQGVWGEFILESILEKSGLQKGNEYQVQVSVRDKEGRLFQPDVIVNLPDNRAIIIDAKVSLTAYERFCAANDLGAQIVAQDEHLKSIRTHIKTLSGKQYQQLPDLNTLDFVLLFIPIESALSLALQHDPLLFSEALIKNIILVTPSTLLATLRTVENVWRYERQNKNAQLIAEHAGLLHDKLVSFIEDLHKLGEKLQITQQIYCDVMSKLKDGRGNIVHKTEQLKKLGAKTSKQVKSRELT